MDQEKFDQHLMDYLFDELDEVTSAAMKRKIESDADCRDLALGLRATLEVAELPVEYPSDDLEERILAAASLAEHSEPWSRKLFRSLAWAGSHAMRPQLAMAAMLVMVVGSSLLLLRVRKGAVTVTPQPEQHANVSVGPKVVAGPDVLTPDDVARTGASTAKPGSPEPVTSARGAKGSGSAVAELTKEELLRIDKQFDEAMAEYAKGSHRKAQRGFATVRATRSPHASRAALFEARSVRVHSGCEAAIAYFNGVRALGGSVAADATLEQADCHRLLGQTAQARQLYLSLKDHKSYGARVTKELEAGGDNAKSGGDGTTSQQRNAPAPSTPPTKPSPKTPPSGPAPQQAPAPAGTDTK